MSNNISLIGRNQIVHLLCEGNGIRTINRLTGYSVNTIMLLQNKLARVVKDYNDSRVHGLQVKNIEADEIRSFVLKRKNIIWIYLAIDRDSKMIIDFHIGKRDTNDARIFLNKVSERIHDKSIISTDCLKSYVSAIKRTPEDIEWTINKKIYLERARVFGDKLGRGITNRIEAHNGVVRQHISRLARRSRGYAKSQDKLKEHLMLFFFYYNFIKKHKTIKTCPGVKIGLIEKPLEFSSILTYLN